jgi:TRAP-type C4-dicarboxylate transport system permease small subunit
METEQRPATSSGRTTLHRLLYWAALGSGAVLALLMFITVADVVARYFFNQPFSGSVELTEMLMVALVMLAMPYCALTGGHIQVDVLDRALGRRGRFLSDLLIAVVGIAVFGFLIYRTGLKAIDTYEYNDLSTMLRLPIWPLYALIVIGFAGYLLVVIRDLLLRLTGRPRD